jgi:hypothetical protein
VVLDGAKTDDYTLNHVYLSCILTDESPNEPDGQRQLDRSRLSFMKTVEQCQDQNNLPGPVLRITAEIYGLYQVARSH